jgi:hypothetical protein
MLSFIKRNNGGHKGLNPIGFSMVTEIQSFSTLRPPKDIEKTPLISSRILRALIKLIIRISRMFSSTTSTTFSAPLILPISKILLMWWLTRSTLR